ncbi:hypothetical protein [Streptomyces sp. SCL15-6]|uniref:hypothetical protein n=1 Tax=Streptomyces sp. SCL15-6 TaxID=2967222 RepID=UPI002966B842|nr:hypothetical protein [Streptomyces sp. SCL15-6]
MRLLRAQGKYGPELREVLPALTGTVLTACGALAGLVVAYRLTGPAAPVAALALAAVVVPVVVGRRRPLSRRRRGYYTPEEIAELDVDGLALAVCRMLRRDGWTVRRAADDGVRPRVQARHDRGHRLEVAFRPVAEPLPDEDPPLAPASRGDRPPRLRLVVHRGTFTRRDVRWARASEDIRLMDGTLLRRWAYGTPLHRLIDLR